MFVKCTRFRVAYHPDCSCYDRPKRKRALPQTTEALQVFSGPSLAPSASSDDPAASCPFVMDNLVQRMTRPTVEQSKRSCHRRPH